MQFILFVSLNWISWKLIFIFTNYFLSYIYFSRIPIILCYIRFHIFFSERTFKEFRTI